MKILQINKFYYLRGGSERHLFELSKILEKHGHEVIPFSLQDGRNWINKYDNYFAQSVDVRKFNLKGIIKTFYNYDAVKRLKKLIKDVHPDIAHLHNISHHLSPAIIKVLKKNNIPIIQTLHDYKLFCPNRQLFSHGKICQACQGGKYYNCTLRSCVQDSYFKSLLATMEAYLYDKILKIYNEIDLFIAPSKFMRNMSVSFGTPKGKIKMLYNFINAKNMFVGEVEKKNPYLLYFGRLSKEKGIETAIRAMKEINNFKLKIVGAGPERENLKEKIKEHKQENRIELVGPKYGDDLEKIITGATAIIIPSIWYENMPYSLLESMAIGKIIIASNIGGMPEIIIDKENGFLFPASDSQTLSNIVNSLEKYNLLKIGEKARQTVLKLNAEKYYQQIIKIYFNLTNRA